MEEKTYKSIRNGLFVIAIGAILMLVGETLVDVFNGDEFITLSIGRKIAIILGESSSFVGSIIEFVGIMIAAKSGLKQFRFSRMAKIAVMVLIIAQSIFLFSGNSTLQYIAKIIEVALPIVEMLCIVGIIMACRVLTDNDNGFLDEVVLVSVIVTSIIELVARIFGGYLESINFYSNASTFMKVVFAVMIALQLFIEIAHVIIILQTRRILQDKIREK